MARLVRYMAPEVLSSAVVPASDVWSAGVMAHQLLTGRFPFDDRANRAHPAISKIWRAPSPGLLPVLFLPCCVSTAKASRRHH